MSRMSKAKVIGGIAAIGLAGAVLLTPVTGADFSDSKTGNVDVSTATLVLNLSDSNGSVGTFDLDYVNLVPGAAQTQTLTITNDGSIAGDVSLGQALGTITNGGSLTTADYAELTVAIPGHLSATAVNQLPMAISLGSLQPGETKSFELEIALAQTAGNEWQGVEIDAVATVVIEQQ